MSRVSGGSVTAQSGCSVNRAVEKKVPPLSSPLEVAIEISFGTSQNPSQAPKAMNFDINPLERHHLALNEPL